ncbi:alkaline phosphatase family protein, partial [Acinetobacter baumannii]
MIVLENHSYAQTVGNPNLPTLNRLAKTYGLAANYYGVAHPSLPNYVAMIAGDTFGSRADDPSQRFNGPTLAGQLEAKGLSWR